MGRVDVYTSRRTGYRKCPFWIRDERDSKGTPSQWVLQNMESGHFYAKPSVAKTNRMDPVTGVWGIDSNRVTIETNDHIDDLSRGCLVKYDGELWLVEMVQSIPHLKEMEFAKHSCKTTIISLIKG